MPGQSQLYQHVFQLEKKFKDYLQGKQGNAAKLKQLRLGLLQALETGERNPLLTRTVARIYGGKTLLRKIMKTVEGNYALPKAIFDRVRWGTGLNKACSRWDCRISDIHAVERIASGVGRWLGSFVEDLEPSKKPWLADVEAAHEELIVHVSSRALEDMILVCIEGYQVPKNRRVPFTEVYGLCLGMVRDQWVSRRGSGKYLLRHVYVERAAVQIRARGTKDGVWPNRESLATQLTIAKSLFSQLEVIGDFHSHPYRKADKLRKQKGWDFSQNDYDQNCEWVEEMREKGHEPRVGFIIAIGKRKHAGGQQSIEYGLPNVKFLHIDHWLVALAAYRILRDAWYESDKIQLKVQGTF